MYPTPASPTAPATLRHRIAPPGADLRLMEIIDMATQRCSIVYVDVSATVREGDHAVVTDGAFAFECCIGAVPMPADLFILGVIRADIVPRVRRQGARRAA